MSSTTRHVVILSLLLSVAGFSLFYYKWHVLQVPLLPSATVEAWTIDARVSFNPKTKSPVKVGLVVPNGLTDYTLLDETFIARGYGITEATHQGNRTLTWTVRRASGEQTLFYQAIVTRKQDSTPPAKEKVPPFPTPPELEEPLATVAAQVVAEVRNTSADVVSFTQRVLKLIDNADEQSGLKLLLSPKRDAASRAQAAQVLVNYARIPARLVYGLELSRGKRRAPPSVRLEVHDGQQWVSLDPVTGGRELPPDFLVWSRGQPPLGPTTGAKNAALSFAVVEKPVAALQLATKRAAEDESLALDLSLLSLPAETQAIYRIALTIPIGALIIVLLRNVVGLGTFGTFAPVLIALAFRETHLLNGVLLFSGIVAVSLLIRFYVERLQLLLVPRLAVVVTVVVIIMALLNIVAFRLGFAMGMSAALFPIVILANTVERMSLVWDELGARAALQQARGSLIAAIVAYLAMSERVVEHLVLVFPELLLPVLSLMLLLGRYSGYRLTELRRFAPLRAK